MNPQINPGYEAFAKSEHNRMLAESANARRIRQAKGHPPTRTHKPQRSPRFTVLKSKFAYAIAIATLSIILAASWAAAAAVGVGGTGGGIDFLVR